jgi:serine/threonine-protein kinase RsbW
MTAGRQQWRSGRSRLLDRFTGLHAREAAGLLKAVSNSDKKIQILSQPFCGTTYLLRTIYQRLFADGTGPMPLYLRVPSGCRSREDLSQAFRRNIISQAAAFRRQDPLLIGAPLRVRDVSDDALAGLGILDEEIGLAEILSALRLYAGRCTLIIDDLHNSATLGSTMVREIIGTVEDLPCSVVIAGHRRFLFGHSTFEPVSIQAPSADECSSVIRMICEDLAISISDASGELITTQLNGIPLFIASFLDAARRKNLSSFSEVQRSYADEVFGGPGSRAIVSLLKDMCGDQQLPHLLSMIASAEPRSTSEAPFGEHCLKALHNVEFADFSFGRIAFERAPIFVKDMAAALTGSDNDSRATAISRELVRYIARAPELMAREYRRRSALDLKNLLEQVSGKTVPDHLLDNGKFNEQLVSARPAAEQITVGEIVFAAHTAHFYGPLSQMLDLERSAVGVYEDGSWLIIADIPSKLAADRERTEFWCDRLDAAAVHAGHDNAKLWLVAPEGFDEEALTVLRARNAFSSSKRQIEALFEHVGSKAAAGDPKTPYKISLPMIDESEMIAASVAEEIASLAGFEGQAINQIKTAVVEACINAAEHSLSPDRTIELEFNRNGNALRIDIRNRGLRLLDRLPPDEAAEQRRGWGLKLIRGLMDEFYINKTDDGTHLTLIKKRA